MVHKMLCSWVVVMGIGPFSPPLAPTVTNQLCYTSQAYRDTHEQECVIDNTSARPGDKPNRGLIGGLLHGLTGGLL